jgi:Uma2 family endonuclease
VSRARLAQLSSEEKKGFLPLCPDFAIELRSPTDDLDTIKAKMEEYIACGLRLGWLIDPETRTVYVYRPNLAVEELKDVTEVSADPELPGFVLDLREIWEPQI